MTAYSGAFSDVLAPGFETILFNEFGAYEDEYPKIVNKQSSKVGYEKSSGVSGFAAVPTKNKGSAITYDDPIQGYDVTFTHTSYGMGFRVERELYDDDRYDVMSQMPKGLGTSARYTIETTAANILNNGFDSSYAGGDALELFSLVHTLTGGGTEQNEMTTPAVLSPTSLQTAINDVAATVNDRGLKIKMIPKLLVVPQALMWDAAVILESAKKSGTANNDKNVFQDLDLKYTVNHYLSSNSYWFLLCEKHYLTMYDRQGLTFENDDDFDTKDAKFSVFFRNSFGWKDWRGSYGVKI